MEGLGFVVDATASEDSELLKTFHNPFPTFTNSKFTLGIESEDEEESELSNEEYYGK